MSSLQVEPAACDGEPETDDFAFRTPGECLRRAAALGDGGRREDAERLLATGIAQLDDDLGLALEYARAASARRDWAAASERWDRLRQRFPQRLDGHLWHAASLRELGRFEEAEAVLRETAAQFPDAPEPLFDLARVAEARTDWNEAARRWHDARARHPENVTGYEGEAAACRQLGRIDEAEPILTEAIRRFPSEPRAHVEWALLAQHRRDWQEAAHRWKNVRGRFPDQAIAHVLGAVALRESGRADEAESLLAAAAERFPHDLGAATEYAWLAVHRRDWDAALRRWEAVRDRSPDRPGGHTGIAMALRELGRLDEAEALLAEACERFPAEAGPAIDHARIAERRGDWPAAAERWERVRTRFAERVEGYLGGAAALNSAGRQDEAERLLETAAARFPQTAQFAAEHAWLAFRQQRWDEAERRFARLRQHFPDDAAGYRGGAEALLRRGRLAEAETLLASGMARIPGDPHIALTHALIPSSPVQRERDWDMTIGRLEALCRRFPEFEQGHVAAARMLRERGRLEEAEAMATRGFRQLSGGGAELGIEYARIAEERADWAGALSRHRQVAERFPDNPAGIVGEAEALARLARFDEAESRLREAMEAFPNHPDPFAAFARLAMRRDRPGEALRRWGEAVRRFPQNGHLLQQLFEARLRALETDPEALAATKHEGGSADTGNKADEAELPPLAELVTAFESLGGTLPGCEFGLVQRAFGAEPLSLLRWTDMEPEGLIAALEAEFDGVGLPENTELLRSSADASAEYGTRDRRFGMRMHTFVPVREAAEDEMFGRLCRRLQFLRDKLIEDLKSGAKIFVYKTTGRNLSAAELARLCGAMRRYGGNTLLYVRYADDRHPNGTVERAEPGLMIGYIDRFAMSPAGERLGEATPSWAEICKNAYRLWRAAAAEEAAAPERVASVPGPDMEPAELVMQFESLGGAGHGCEFGIVQREMGTEPLGLLRWADLAPHFLAAALEDEFDGVGLPEHTEVFVPEDPSGHREYWTRDRRYWMAMRTFMLARDIGEAEMRERVCRRLQFLRRKLIEDLRTGSKIFVYKVLARNLETAEIARIHNAMRRYGDNTLLYVRYADSQHPDGTVEIAARGLMVGYIDHFSYSPEDVYIGSAAQSWLGICRNAFRLWAPCAADNTAAAPQPENPGR